MRFRIQIFSLAFIFLFLTLIVRLFFWQVVRGQDLSEEARSQYEKGQVVSAPRGNILASDGTWLAARSESWLVFASLPDLEENPKEIADKLAPLFVDIDAKDEEKVEEASRLISLLTRKDVVWVPLKQRINQETKKKIEEMEIEAIGFESTETRSYPEGSSSAHLMGFVGKNDHGENIGYFGLEGYYDLLLSGKPGYFSRESDARGVPILFGNSKEISAVQGIDLKTHINKAVQITLERNLKEGLERYGAKAGTGIIMDPKTGAILAMASYPSFDPFDYQEYSDQLFRNPSVSESFEPGSIFKVLVMAAGLDAGEVEKDTKCDICAGPYKVDKYYINTWNNEYNSDATMTDVIIHSDNVGMVFVAQKLGADRLYDYLDKFGIGHIADVDLQGESSPKMRERGTWSIVDLATTSFGQGIATTPIQMIKAVGAIANDGVVMKPQVVDKLIGDGWEEDIKPQDEGRVISKKAADDITAMMAEAASAGESKWIYAKGSKVAGKTGTAQIPIEGHYDDEKTIASFVGFAPYDDPKFVMLISLKEPQSSPWASETAAPLWFSIAKDLFLYMGIQPE